MLFKKSSKRKTIKRRSPRPRKNSTLLELAIVIILVLVVIYAAGFAIRITQGFSKTIETPEHIVRVQILNGCGAPGAAGKIARELPGLVQMPLEVHIIDVGDFEASHVEKTFMISRDSDLEAAEMLARQLALDGDRIHYQPLENNYRSIAVTIVLGDDFNDILKKQHI